MSTLGFERDPRERDAVLRQVARLPGSVEPARDLWPAVEAKIRARRQPAPLPRRTLSWQWALAAGTAIASVSVLFTWLALRNPEAGAPVVQTAGTQAPAGASSLQPVSYGSYARLGPEYLEVRAQLSAEFQQRVAQLPPDTRDQVARNLAVIQQAAADIDAALARDPSSRLLNRLLLSTYQDELALYSHVTAAAQRPLERT